MNRVKPNSMIVSAKVVLYVFKGICASIAKKAIQVALIAPLSLLISVLERSVSELNVIQRVARQRAATLKWTQYLTTEGLTWAQGMRDEELMRKYKAHWALSQRKKPHAK